MKSSRTSSRLFFALLWLCCTAPAYGEFFGAIAGGLQSGMEQAPEGVPKGLVHVAPDLPAVIWVDLANGAMHVLEQSRPGWFSEQEVIPISIGKAGYDKLREGDLKTPVGVYQVTRFLSDAALDDKYGHGAFPLNYPNAYDRLRARTGSGIWLHGLPKGVESRPRLDSDGCVVVGNETLDRLHPLIKARETLVVLAPELQWGSEPSLEDEQLLATIKQWQKDWQNIDNDAYLSHYAASFTDSKRDLAAWKRYKTRVNKNKREIKVTLQKMTVVAYPGEDHLAAARFFQVYESNNYQWRGWKQLLWQLGPDGEWRIIYEGNG
jgi:murein L,D-transpeptidase YafK